MGAFIFLTMVFVEIVLGIYCIIAKSNQRKLRSKIRIVTFAVFILLISLGIIDWGFRYYALAAFLLGLSAFGAMNLICKMEERREFKSTRVVLNEIGIITLILLVSLPSILFPKYKGIHTTGKYQVATSTYTYTDKNRIESYSKNGENRKLNVQMWYPKNAEGSYPLIVFSHGSFGVKSSNESLYNELASHGYVVCSIDHTYQCFSTTDKDGNRVYMDKGYVHEVNVQNPKLDIEQSYELYQKWMSIRMGDINFVIDDILSEVKNNNADRVYKLIDTTKIGVMGHSLGGSAALGMGRIRKDISAVIALESPFLYDIKGVKDGRFVYTEEKYNVPVLNVYSDASWSHLGEWLEYGENYSLLTGANDEAFNAHIKGAGHLALTDFSLTSPLLEKTIDKMTGAKSTVDNVYCLKTINKVCLEFFDCYLKGQGKFISEGTY